MKNLCTYCRHLTECVSKRTSIRLFEGFSDAKQDYFKDYLAIVEENFLVTDKFCNLLVKIDSGKMRVSIGGPNGVVALAAIATICHGIRQPCVLLSPSRDVKTSTDYIKEEFSKLLVNCLMFTTWRYISMPFLMDTSACMHAGIFNYCE